MSEYLWKIDALVAEHVMKECRHQWKAHYPGSYAMQCQKCRKVSSRVPTVGEDTRYSSDPAASLAVEERLLEDGWAITVEKHVGDNEPYIVTLTNDKRSFWWPGKTRGLALARCALEAYGVEVPLEEGENSV